MGAVCSCKSHEEEAPQAWATETIRCGKDPLDDCGIRFLDDDCTGNGCVAAPEGAVAPGAVVGPSKAVDGFAALLDRHLQKRPAVTPPDACGVVDGAESVLTAEPGDAAPRDTKGVPASPLSLAEDFEDISDVVNGGAPKLEADDSSPTWVPRCVFEEGVELEQDLCASFFAELVLPPGARVAGMDVDITAHEFSRISRVHETGPIAEYNSKAPEYSQIRQGDLIVSVNDERGCGLSQAALLGAGGSVRLGIRRPISFTVSASRAGDARLGLDVVCFRSSTALYISKILDDGLIPAHNDEHPTEEVRPGDLIVSVNKQVSEGRELMNRLIAGGELELTITRP